MVGQFLSCILKFAHSILQYIYTPFINYHINVYSFNSLQNNKKQDWLIDWLSMRVFFNIKWIIFQQ